MWSLLKTNALLITVQFSQLMNVESLQWRFVNNGDALCNDFTPAGYYVHRNLSSPDWVVFLEGGGACFSAETCNRRYLNRKTRLRYGGGEITQPFDVVAAWNENIDNRQNIMSPLMTSIFNLTNGQDTNITGTDLLSTDCSINPDFCGYNHVLIPYCSSDFWLGNDTRFNTYQNNDFQFAPNATELQFIFKGFVIFQSVITKAIPLNTTGTVLLAGSSSGGIGALNHAKWLRKRLTDAHIRVLTDSAWFVNFHDNIYRAFTDFTNISEDSRTTNFNITEYVLSQPTVSLYTLLLHHEPCNSIELGPPCCISPYCLIVNPNYYPADVPVLTSFSLYDAYLLSPSLIGIEPYNAQETSFEVHFENRDETEPVGLNFNFLRIIGEYGGVMNSTLDISSHQSAHLSYYVTSCLQHVYLATSSLWGSDGVLGSDTYEFSNDVSLIRHTVEQGRWINFKLTQLSTTNDDIEYNISLRDAIGIWLNTANSTKQVKFREACHVTHCNELCPEEIRVEKDDSFLWEEQTELVIYCLVITVTFLCFAIKGVFSYWHYMLLSKQNQFLQSVKDIETRNAIYQFPECECEDKISIACLDLYYSVPFNHNKDKSDYDVAPMVLPNPEDDSIDGSDEEYMDDDGDDDMYTVCEDISVNAKEKTIPYGRTVRAGHKDDSDKDNAESLHSNSPLLKDNSEALPFPDIGNVVKRFFEDDIKQAAIREKNISEQKEKVKVILKGISLYFNPGQLIAIMGPSGSGKTTFLDLITGRRRYGHTKGSIFVNGHRLDDIRDWYIANSGYVLQLAMPYYEELTVRENLTLAAQMRLSFSMREKFARIEQVMNETGLQELAGTVVGGTVGPGLSGGQKKRLTIALQLLRLPSVIFLDEPTSGLDSASSFELLMHLNRLAGSQRTVIMTIHQPRMEIFHMFTRLIMLCEGKVAYHGSPFKAYEVFITALKAQYLEKGLVLPQLEDQNPADVIMDMLGNSKMRDAILQYYEESGDPQEVFETIKESQEDEKNLVDETRGRLAQIMFGIQKISLNQGSLFVRMSSLEARASLRSSISQLAYLPVIFFLYGFLLGTVYIQTTSAVLIVSGFCVYSVASALFMFPIMHSYYSRALSLYRLERSDGIGHGYDLVIQGFTRFVFLGLIPVAMCAGILYLLVIMVSSYSLEVYLQVLVVNMALNQTWIALLIFVLCAFPRQAFRLSPVISSVAGFTSGFFIPRESMPPWYRWLFFINPNYYGFSSTAYLLLKEFDSNCAGSELECYVTSGDYTLTQFNFNETNPALHVMILLVMTVCYLLLAIVAMRMRHSSSVLRKLRSFFSRDTKTELIRWSMSHAGIHKATNNKEDTDIELQQCDATSSSNLGINISNAQDEVSLYYDQNKPVVRNKPANRKKSIESHYSLIGNNQVGACSKEMTCSPQHCTTIADNDLSDSLTQLEIMLFPHTNSQSNSSHSFQKHEGLRVAGDAPKNNQFVRIHSLGEVLDSSRPIIRSQQDDNFDQEIDFRAPTSQSRVTYCQKQQCKFQGKFLDNECHEIWKPNKARRTSLPAQLVQRVSPSPQTLYLPSYKQQEDETVSPSDSGAPSPIMCGKDLRLRQQQLLEHIAMAREVSKDQNLKLLQNTNATQPAPLAKFKHLVNTALAQKWSNLTPSENARLKWKKAISFSHNTPNKLQQVTAVKLANKQKSVNNSTQNQRSIKKPFIGTTPQSKSVYLPSPSPRSTLKSRKTFAAILNKTPNAIDRECEFDSQVSSHSRNRTASMHEDTCITVDIINNNFDSDSETADLDDSSTGFSWSGCDTTSTTVTSITGTPLLEETHKALHQNFTRSSAMDTHQQSPATKCSSTFSARRSRLCDTLSPPGAEVVDKLSINYRPYSHSSTTGSSTGLVHSKGYPKRVVSNFSTLDMHLSNHPIVSASSVVPQVVPSENTSQNDLIPHNSSSTFAGQQVHRHNEKH